MRMKPLLVAALLGTACGAGMSPSVPPSSASTVSDAGSTRDGGEGAPGSCDCSGMALPDICMMCGMGMGETMCAHFVCDFGQCAVQICP